MSLRARSLAPFLALVAAACSKNTDVPAAPDTCGKTPPRILSVAVEQGGAPVSRAELGAPVTIAVAAEDPDVACSDAVVSFAWTFVSAPSGSAAQVPSGARTSSITFTPDLPGTFQFRVAAVDKRGNSSDPVLATVATGPCGPTVADPGFSFAPALPSAGQAVALTAASVTDACVRGGGLTYAWSLASRPPGSGAVVVDASAASATLATDVSGAYGVQLTVTDAGGFSTVVTRPVFVATCAAAPAAGAIVVSPPLPNRGDLVALSAPVTPGSCAVAGAGTFSYEWTLLSSPPGSTATLGGAREAIARLVPDVAGGTWQLMLTVRDGLGNAAPPVFATVTSTTCGARRPVATLSPQGATVNARTALTIAGATADPEAGCPAAFALEPASFAWSFRIASQPAGASGSLTGTGPVRQLVGDLAGVYVVEAVVTTPDGRASAPATTAVAVSSCGGNAPVVTGVATTAGGVATSRPPVGSAVVVTPFAFDLDAVPGGVCGGAPFAPPSFEWTLVSAPAGSAVAVPAGPVPGPLAFTADVAGTYALRVVAVDDLGLASEPVLVTVPTGTCGPDLAGILASPSSTPVVGSTVSLAATPASVTSPCVAGGGLAFSWSLASRPAASAAAVSGVGAAATLVPDVPGSYVVELVATDAGGFSTVAQRTIVAGGCTSAPLLGAVASSPVAVYRGDRVDLSVPVTPGGCGLASSTSFSWDWTMLSRPTGSAAVLGGASAATPSFVADVPGGSWPVMVIVHDGLGNASAPAYGTIAASDCGGRSPLVATAASPSSAHAYQGVTLSATVTDADAAGCPARFVDPSTSWAVAWSVASAPPGAHPQLVPASAGAPATFQSDVPGSYLLQATATGLDGTRGTATQPVSVDPCGAQAPSVAAPTWFQSVPGGPTFSYPTALAVGFPAALSAVASDPDASPGCNLPQPLSWAWQLVSAPPGSAAVLQGASTATPSLTPDVAGSWVVAVTVTDPQGHQAVAQQFVTASCGAAPPAVATAPGGFPALTASQVVPSVTLAPGSPPQPLTLVRSSASGTWAQLYAGFPVQLTTQVVDLDAACGLSQTISYAWSLTAVPPGSAARLDDPSLASPSFTPDLPGEYDLALVLRDSTGRTSTTSFGVIPGVGPFLLTGTCNTRAPVAQIALTAPFAAAAGFGAAAEPRGTAFLDGSASASPDALPVSLGGCGLARPLGYAWSFDQVAPGTVPQLATDGVAASFPAAASGSYVVRLTVSDGARTGTTTATVSTEPPAPVAPAGAGQAAFVSSAVDPTNGREVLAWLELGATSSPLRVARCIGSCATPAAQWWVVTVDDLGPTPFSWAAGEEPRPLDVKVESTGTVVVAYGTGPGPTGQGVAPCALAVATVAPSGATLSRTLMSGAGCDAAGAGAGNDWARWVSLGLLPGDLPALAASLQSQAGGGSSWMTFAVCSSPACDAIAGLAPVGASFPNATSGRWPSLSISPSGAARLVHAEDVPGGSQLDYAECPASCTDPASWTRGTIASGAPGYGRYASLAPTASGSPRVAFADAGTSIVTASCDAGCTAPAAWTAAPFWTLTAPTGLSLATSASGAPFVAVKDGDGTVRLGSAAAYARPVSSTFVVDTASGPAPSLLLLGTGSPRISCGDGGALKTIRYGN